MTFVINHWLEHRYLCRIDISVSAAEGRKEGSGLYESFRDFTRFCLCDELVRILHVRLRCFDSCSEDQASRFLVQVQPKLLHWAADSSQAQSKEGESARAYKQTTLYSQIYLPMLRSSDHLQGEGIKPYTCKVFIPFITWKDQGRLEDEEQWSLLRSSGENKHGRISCCAPEQQKKANWGGGLFIHSAFHLFVARSTAEFSFLWFKAQNRLFVHEFLCSYKALFKKILQAVATVRGDIYWLCMIESYSYISYI